MRHFEQFSNNVSLCEIELIDKKCLQHLQDRFFCTIYCRTQHKMFKTCLLPLSYTGQNVKEGSKRKQSDKKRIGVLSEEDNIIQMFVTTKSTLLPMQQHCVSSSYSFHVTTHKRVKSKRKNLISFCTDTKKLDSKQN